MSPAVRKQTDGVKYMMYNRNEHPVAHLHVLYSGDDVVIRISDQEVLEGYIPGTQLRAAKKWIKEHGETLLEMWKNRMVEGGIKRIAD